MTQIAIQVGCSPSHLSDIFSGRRRVTPKMAPKLARALNLPPAKVQDSITAWAAQAAFAQRRTR